MASETSTLNFLRRALLATLLVGMVGTGAELILLGHIEGFAQFIPLGLIGAGMAAGVWQAIHPSSASVKALQALMALFVAAGGLGVVLHYRGNLEFELEMYPTMSGTELVQKVATGATPVLAPGTMSLLGLIGLLHAHRHPALDRLSKLEEEES